MRPFASWPRWAINLLRVVLVRVGVMPALLFRLDVECWERDVVEFEYDDSVPGWPCASPMEWQ